MEVTKTMTVRLALEKKLLGLAHDHPDIEKDWEAVYEPLFQPERTLYRHMDVTEKKAYQPYVLEWYTDYIGVTEEMLEKNEQLLQEISEFEQGQEFASYADLCAQSVVKAHADPLDRTKNSLDRTMRTANKTFVDGIDTVQEEKIEKLKAFATAYKRTGSLKY